MKLKYFASCQNIEAAKKLYHKLAIANHPDLGGNIEIMKEINNEFDFIAEKLKNIHESINGENYTTEDENTEIPSEFRDMINNLIHLEGVIIELVGRWIWLTGNTYANKDEIKKLNFKYASKKQAWYWHKEEDACVNRKKMSLEQIKEKYGCQNIKTVSKMCIA